LVNAPRDRPAERYRIELRNKQGTDVTEQQIMDLAAAERIPLGLRLKVPAGFPEHSLPQSRAFY
jgi:hypothetical protein